MTFPITLTGADIRSGGVGGGGIGARAPLTPDFEAPKFTISGSCLIFHLISGG